MKGIILAGGLGTRLQPLTKITNKHLLPVYDRPMIYYPIEMLAKAGITEIVVAVGGQHQGEFLPLLESGQDFGLAKLSYVVQSKAGGIAYALGLCESFAAGEPVVVVLGDNIIEGNIRRAVREFSDQTEQAKILLSKVHNPKAYGVPVMEGGKIVRIEEKPEHPQSDFAVIGIYFYPADVFEIVKTLQPSGRGELEITDVNNAYLSQGRLSHSILQGWWGDAGEDKDALLNVSVQVARTGANHIWEEEV